MPELVAIGPSGEVERRDVIIHQENVVNPFKFASHSWPFFSFQLNSCDLWVSTTGESIHDVIVGQYRISSANNEPSRVEQIQNLVSYDNIGGDSLFFGYSWEGRCYDGVPIRFLDDSVLLPGYFYRADECKIQAILVKQSGVCVEGELWCSDSSCRASDRVQWRMPPSYEYIEDILFKMDALSGRACIHFHGGLQIIDYNVIH